MVHISYKQIYLRLCTRSYKDLFIYLFQVNQNVSLVLISDTSNQVVAVRVSFISKKNKQFDMVNIKSEGLLKIVGIIKELRSFCDVYEHYKVDECVSFIALGVHKDYRRKGIGLKVQKAAVTMAKNFDLGPILLKGEGTSNFSKKIYEKLGFDILAEVLYENHKENGEVVFRNMGDDKSIKLYGKVVG